MYQSPFVLLSSVQRKGNNLCNLSDQAYCCSIWHCPSYKTCSSPASNFLGHNIKNILLISLLLTKMSFFFITLNAVKQFWSNLSLLWIPRSRATCPILFAYAWSVLYYFTLYSQSHIISAYIACPRSLYLDNFITIISNDSFFYILHTRCYVTCFISVYQN